MYDITIRARVDAAVVPYELKNIELTEMAIESAVGIILEKLFSIVDMKEVTLNPSSRERELDLDSLLSQDA